MMSEDAPAGRLISRRWLETPNKQALVIAAIFATSALTFYILFDAASKIEYFKEILAALMGTLLTAVITTLLLSSQTASAESKERSVELFKRKFDLYSTFVEIASLHTADRILSQRETIKLLSLFHKIRLLSDKKTAESVFLFIENNFFKEDCPAFSMDYVLMVLKNDLFAIRESLEEVNLVDTSKFVRLINTDQETLNRHQNIVRGVLDKMFKKLDSVTPPVLDTLIEASSHSEYTELSFITREGLTYNLPLAYEIIDDPDSFLGFSGDVEIDPQLTRRDVINAASLIGFSYDEIKGALGYMVDIKTRKNSYVCEGYTVWSVRHFCDCVVELERKIGQSPDRTPS